MSDAPHATAAHESHSAHAHDVYEGKPADTIPPDEPHSPMWLPIVGIALVLLAILGVALMGPSESEASQAAASASAAVAAPPPGEALAAAGATPETMRPRPAGSIPLRVPGLPSAMPRPPAGAGQPGQARPAPGQPGPVAPGLKPARRPSPDAAAAPKPQ